MTTFYKGAKGNSLKDKVLQNYIDGIYINKYNQTEKLTADINKYNKKFIKEINNINTDFYMLTIAERIAIELFKLNSNHKYSELNNLYRLISAQINTIKYNKVLRTALYTYGITKQSIFNQLELSINMQKGRLDRNKQLLLSLLDDYGLTNIIKLIEEDNNTTFLEHVRLYVVLLYKESNNHTDYIDKEYYDELVNSYIQYVKDLASKQNINIDNNISESLLKHREILKDRIDKANKELRESKEKEKAAKQLNLIEEDNTLLNNDINSNWDEGTYKLHYRLLNNLREECRNLGGKAFYCAIAKGSQVYYIKENSELTASFTKAKKFNNNVDAKDLIERAINRDEKLKNYNISIQYITLI